MLGLIIPILIGFAMATLGVALLFLGEVPFLGGKRIGAARARLIGLVLVSFLPLSVGTHQALSALYGRDNIDGQILTWSLCGGCWFVVLVLLFRVVVPKRQTRRASAPAGKNPFGAAEVPMEAGTPVTDGMPWETPEPAPKQAVKKSAPCKAPPARKPAKPSSEDSSPFDFS